MKNLDLMKSYTVNTVIQFRVVILTCPLLPVDICILSAHALIKIKIIIIAIAANLIRYFSVANDIIRRWPFFSISSDPLYYLGNDSIEKKVLQNEKYFPNK